MAQHINAMWRNANAIAARESKDWWKQYVVRVKKPRAKPSKPRPLKTAEHRKKIADTIRARWQEKVRGLGFVSGFAGTNLKAAGLGRPARF